MMPKDILIISTADWDSPIQTNKQYVAKELSKLGYRILYVESLGIRKIKLNKADFIRILKRLIKLIFPVIKKKNNIYVLSPIIIPGVTNKYTIAANKFIFNFKLFMAMKFLKFKKEIIWTYNPLTTLYIDTKKFNFRIYHAVDAIENQPYMPKSLILKNERILASNVNKIFVTSLSLLDKFSEFKKKTAFYGNVCDYDHFSKSLTIKAKDVPNDIKYLRKPIVGFIGSISEYKLDFNLIIEVSNQLKDISFVFIGPTNDIIEKNKIDLLKDQKNIFLLGYKNYEILPKYCAYFDVAWLPLIKNQYTKSMFPMKFFEYLAAGLPVVSTSIESLQDFKDVAIICENNFSEMAKNITLAIQNKSDGIKSRLEKAKENTYSRRTRMMLNELDF